MDQLTIQQAFDLAVRRHQGGQLAEAERLYRQVLARQPDHADALHLLGVVAHQVGQNDIAVDLIRRSIAINPRFSQAYSSLGNVLKARGQLDEAIAACRQAIALNPNFPEAYSNLGTALKQKGNLDQAIAAYQQAITLKPDLAEAHNNLGNALKEKGLLDDAIGCYRQAVSLKPRYAEAYCNLGNALAARRQFDEATAVYHQAIAIAPNYAEAYFNLGNTFKEQSKLDEAIGAYRRAIALRANFHEAQYNLGTTFIAKGQLDEAIGAYRQAIAIKPDYADAYLNLGNALKDKGQLDMALAAYREATKLKPHFLEAQINVGNALKDEGQLDDALAVYRVAVAENPEHAGAHSNLVFALQFHRSDDAGAITEEQRRWNQQHAEPLRKFIPTHSNMRDAGRRLRIGYVSPDFRQHVVGQNLLPLFEHHDHSQFEIFCYANVPVADGITRRFEQLADGWRNIAGRSDEEAAQQILEDRIDILVDLSLHSADNRLLVFARKPAPVQVTFAGYPGSTGLRTIDYRLSDPFLDPPGGDESIYSEQTVRLPDSFWCYDPGDMRDIQVNALPAMDKGTVTFGCLNNFCKVNEFILPVWAAVMRQVEHSRLLLLAPEGSHRQRTVDQFAREGIEASRIEFISQRSRREYLQVYHRIDLALDTFPYNGHTTSLDSFWMGVPVITLVGKTVVSRAGWCQLSNLGLRELAGQTPDQFVQIATELAKDLPRLGALRSTLRQRMEQSPLMDAPKFARGIEAAYRRMWRTWCQSNGSDTT